jgi:uncharacterized protein (DUF433 family)
MAESKAALDEMTTAEAAFVLGVDPTRIKKACANHVVEAGGSGAARKLAYGDVVFLRYYLTHPDLSVDQRTTLYKNLKQSHAKQVRPQTPKAFSTGRTIREQRKPVKLLVAASHDGTMVVDLTPSVAEVSERAAELVRLREAVEDGPNGEPLLRGTNVPVYRIAALVQAPREGQPDTSEARKGFPSLSEEQITTAYSYSLAYPKKGRPYPAKSIKSMLDEIEFPVMSEDNDDGENE